MHALNEVCVAHRGVQRGHGHEDAEDDGEDGDADIEAAVINGLGVKPVEEDANDGRTPRERTDLC